MHPYATDSSERKYVPLLIAVISVSLAWLLNWILNALHLTIPWWIDAPSVMGFYGLLYSLFNRCFWRVPILRKVGLVKVPNLTGTWKGYVASSFDEHCTKHDATVTIRQNWSGISITFQTEHSSSHSLTACILSESPIGAVLNYEYLNEPKPDARETMHAHRGTARLTLKGGSLEGEYYTGRDRQSYGSLSLRRLEGKV